MIMLTHPNGVRTVKVNNIINPWAIIFGPLATFFTGQVVMSAFWILIYGFLWNILACVYNVKSMEYMLNGTPMAGLYVGIAVCLLIIHVPYAILAAVMRVRKMRSEGWMTEQEVARAQANGRMI